MTHSTNGKTGVYEKPGISRIWSSFLRENERGYIFQSLYAIENNLS